MGAGPNLAEAAQATAFTENVAERWWSEFRARLCGIYRIGSLAHGGFNATL